MNPVITHETARPRHAALLSATMREADALEAASSSGESPLESVARSIQDSAESWAVFFDGSLACVWGVARHHLNGLEGKTIGYGWLLTSEVVNQYPKAFWQECLRVLPSVLRRWDMLINWIDARHGTALRWAHRLGFRMEEPTPYGPFGFDFVPFVVTHETFLARRGGLLCA